MCVFLTVDFSECALSASVFISACLSSCQNLFGHMCFCFLILCVCVSLKGGRESKREGRVFLFFFDNPSPLCFFGQCACACECLCAYVTTACWLTGCCSAF